MNNNKPYEISVWEDVLVEEYEDRVIDPDGEHSGASATGIEIEGQTYGINMGVNAGYLSLEKNENGTSLVYTEINEVTHKADLDLENYEVVNCLVKERKIGIIGSSSMTAQHRAMNGKLVSNVNGSNTLTFSMYHKYHDNETGEYVENPFIKLLTNERRVKLRLGNPGDADVEWYDFVIKNVQESSDSKVFNYTCTDLFINELSKNGYNITLDGELENNIGTVDELAGTVLVGTDWKIGKSDLIHTYSEEPVCRISFGSDTTLTPVSKKPGDENKNFVIKANIGALAFYSSINARGKELQILCPLTETGDIDNTEGEGPSRKWVMDEDGRVVASEHTDKPAARQFIVPVTFTEGETFPNEVEQIKLDTKNMDLRGKRIVRAQETKYDANLGKYVSKYTGPEYETDKVDENGEKIKSNTYWCFAESDKTELTVLNNYITNPSAFKDTSGWEVLTKEIDDKAKVSFASSYTSGLVSIDENGDFKNEKLNKPVNSWIKMAFGSGKTIGNTGLWDYLYDYDKIAEGDTFILGVVYDDVTWPKVNGVDDYTQSPTVIEGTSSTPNHSIKLFNSKWIGGTEVANATSLTIEDVVGVDKVSEYSGWHFYSFEFNTNISHKELVEKELRLCFDGGDICYLREAMLFKKYLVRKTTEEANGQQLDILEIVQNEDDADCYLLPGDFTNKPLVLPEYKVYKDGDSDGKDLESMTYILETKDITVLEDAYTPYYDEAAAARVQVTAKESNRFNILQDIAEAAQCQVKFSIKHNAHTGHIEMDTENKPIKQVSFHQFAGKNNSAGFKYGINLKSIQRTIESNQLTSKLIVKPNSNEFADAKQCAIGKAQSNPTKEDVIYNLDYYINHEMIDYEIWMDDMYGSDESDGKICYQKKMKEAVENYDKINEQVVYYSNLINKLESEYTVYKEARDAAVEARKAALDSITDYCSTYTYNQYINLVKQDWITIEQDGNEVKIYYQYDDEDRKTVYEKPKTIQGLKTFCTKFSFQFMPGSIESYFDHYVADKMIEIDTLSEKIQNYDTVLKDDPKIYTEEEMKTGLAASVEQTKEEYKNLKAELKKIREAREELESKLFSRYGRFIQEGTWISEDYFDNELYYLEAVNVSNTSAFPQVSYTINVIDVSRVEGYENITFAVGDKSYIQDTEFFGWKMIDTDDGKKKTPYKEEVICSEITRVLDDGSQNTIKIQNYKNQFEGLFQRITATTQQVQYKSGEYQKAANGFTESGELQNGLLSTALEQNKESLLNSLNNETSYENGGILTINLDNPNMRTKIVGGAVAVSNDGGQTWGQAITGNGVNAKYLCAGTIDAGVINIRSGKNAAFTWDVKGISAYSSKYKDATGGIKDRENFDTSTFVRFDQFGIYGVKNDRQFLAKSSEEINIYNPVTPYGLTWDGFFFRTGEVGTGVTIDSTDGICVREGYNPKVKIGLISDGKYGIEIYNTLGEKVIEQGSDGNLSITGVITAKAGGYIGGWNIQEGYIGTDSIFLSEGGIPKLIDGASKDCSVYVNGKFAVTTDGNLYATAGKIGGFEIKTNILTNAFKGGVVDMYSMGISPGIDAETGNISTSVHSTDDTIGLCFWAGARWNGDTKEIGSVEISKAPFRVYNDGYMCATKGKIGGWKIDSDALRWGETGTQTALLDPTVMGKSGYVVFGVTDTAGNYNNGFYVDGLGKLYAKGATITGSITATSGKIGNLDIDIVSKAMSYTTNGNTVYIGQEDSPLKITRGGRTLFGVNATGEIYMNPAGDSIGANVYVESTGVYIRSVSNDHSFAITKGSIQLTSSNGTISGTWKLSGSLSGMKMDNTSNTKRVLIQPDSKEGFSIGKTGGYGDLLGEWWCNNAKINNSDARLKNSIQQMDDRYNLLFDNLNPVIFKYNDGQSDRYHTGFIAQEALWATKIANLTTQDFAAVCSRDVNDENAYMGIRYEEFVSLNTWQIQKLKSRVSELEAKIAQLEAKI